MIILRSIELYENRLKSGPDITLNIKEQMQALICHCRKSVKAFAEVKKICVEVNVAEVAISGAKETYAKTAILEIEEGSIELVVRTNTKKYYRAMIPIELMQEIKC